MTGIVLMFSQNNDSLSLGNLFSVKKIRNALVLSAFNLKSGGVMVSLIVFFLPCYQSMIELNKGFYLDYQH